MEQLHDMRGGGGVGGGGVTTALAKPHDKKIHSKDFTKPRVTKKQDNDVFVNTYVPFA